MASASIISIAAGTTPAAMIADVAAPACVGGGERGEQGAHRLGQPGQPHGHLGGDAERALRADERAEQVVAGRVRRPPPSSHQVAVGGDDLAAPVTWLVVKPYLRQCAPPEFSATLPPIEQICWLDGSGA